MIGVKAKMPLSTGGLVCAIVIPIGSIILLVTICFLCSIDCRCCRIIKGIESKKPIDIEMGVEGGGDNVGKK